MTLLQKTIVRGLKDIMNQTIMESVHIEKEELCLEEFRQWGDTGDQPGQKRIS